MSSFELPQDSFLASFLLVLDQQDNVLQHELLHDTREDLILAFSEGSIASNANFPMTTNPYEECDGVAYSKNLAWNEGWAYAKLSSGKLLTGFK